MNNERASIEPYTEGTSSAPDFRSAVHRARFPPKKKGLGQKKKEYTEAIGKSGNSMIKSGIKERKERQQVTEAMKSSMPKSASTSIAKLTGVPPSQQNTGGKAT